MNDLLVESINNLININNENINKKKILKCINCNEILELLDIINDEIKLKCNKCNELIIINK